MTTQDRIKVWDPLVRIVHWTLVLAFFIAYFTEDDFITLHVYAGYTVIGLALFRIIWGFIGPRYARFSNFVTPPGVAWQYLKDTLALRAKRYLGHNPTGSTMVVLLLVNLLITTFTRSAVYGVVESAGTLGSWLGNSSEF